MTRSLPFDRARVARAAAVVLALAGAACSDGGTPVTPGPTLPQPSPEASSVAAFTCAADVRALTVSCGDAATPGGARAARIIGGQNVNVRLTGTNLAYDSVAEVYSLDVTVQNLGVQRLGTRDGSTVTGVQVFFHNDPTTSAGTGVVTVANPTGYGDFTGTEQPYFLYPQVLPLNAVSTPLRWRYNVPRTVQNFVFKVYVRADVLPVVVFDYVQGGNRDIYRVAIDGSDLTRLTTSTGDDQNPTYAAGKVVFTSFRDGNGELYSVPVTGGTDTRLTTSSASEIEPALSRDGTRLAFTTDASGVNKLWTSAADGTGRARATSTSFGFGGSIEAAPSWAPSGNRVTFVATNLGSADIYDFPLSGEPTLLVGGDSTDIEPTWSPDGTRLAFASRRSGDTEIYLLAASTGQITRLTTRAGTDSQPVWLSDGRLAYVVYNAGTPRLWWMDPANPATATAIPIPAGAAQRPSGFVF